jgi:hypothetical protein
MGLVGQQVAIRQKPRGTLFVVIAEKDLVYGINLNSLDPRGLGRVVLRKLEGWQVKHVETPWQGVSTQLDWFGYSAGGDSTEPPGDFVRCHCGKRLGLWN